MFSDIHRTHFVTDKIGGKKEIINMYIIIFLVITKLMLICFCFVVVNNYSMQKQNEIMH